MLSTRTVIFLHSVDEVKSKNVQQIGLHSKIRLQHSDVVNFLGNPIYILCNPPEVVAQHNTLTISVFRANEEFFIHLLKVLYNFSMIDLIYDLI